MNEFMFFSEDKGRTNPLVDDPVGNMEGCMKVR